MGLNRLTCKPLAGAPTAQIVHLMVHQEHLMKHLRLLRGPLGTDDGHFVPMKPRFLDKFSREFGNKSVLYETISMRYSNKSALYETISMRYGRCIGAQNGAAEIGDDTAEIGDDAAEIGGDAGLVGLLVHIGAPKNSVGAPTNYLQDNRLWSLRCTWCTIFSVSLICVRAREAFQKLRKTRCEGVLATVGGSARHGYC